MRITGKGKENKEEKRVRNVRKVVFEEKRNSDVTITPQPSVVRLHTLSFSGRRDSAPHRRAKTDGGAPHRICTNAQRAVLGLPGSHSRTGAALSRRVHPPNTSNRVNKSIARPIFTFPLIGWLRKKPREMELGIPIGFLL